MHDDQNIARPSWRDMLDEQNALEILELQDRNRGLSLERDTFRVYFLCALEALHRLLADRVRRRDENRQLREENRQLRAKLSPSARRAA
jgi:hypothetical protein